jgi:hypothetical protein
MKIAYIKTDGRAHDLRFVAENYVPQAGETVISGDELPPLASLHDVVVLEADARAIAVRAIETAREVALQGGVTWNTKLYHVDATFQAHITGLIAAYEAGIIPAAATQNIRTKDNDIVQLNYTQLKQLAGTVLVKVQQIWQTSWDAKDALE